MPTLTPQPPLDRMCPPGPSSGTPAPLHPGPAPRRSIMAEQPVRFAAIGLNHNHIYGQARMLLAAGAELVSYSASEPELAAEFEAKYPQARLAGSAQEILEDESIQLIATAAIAGERAGI